MSSCVIIYRPLPPPPVLWGLTRCHLISQGKRGRRSGPVPSGRKEGGNVHGGVHVRWRVVPLGPSGGRLGFPTTSRPVRLLPGQDVLESTEPRQHTQPVVGVTPGPGYVSEAYVALTLVIRGRVLLGDYPSLGPRDGVPFSIRGRGSGGRSRVEGIFRLFRTTYVRACRTSTPPAFNRSTSPDPCVLSTSGVTTISPHVRPRDLSLDPVYHRGRGCVPHRNLRVGCLGEKSVG